MRRCSTSRAVLTTRRASLAIGIARRSLKRNLTCIRVCTARKIRAMICNEEAIAWSAVSQGWRQLWGDFDRLGVALQWHDFRTERALDWGRSFRPRSLEFCLNVGGRGAGGDHADYIPGRAGCYPVEDETLRAMRQERHHHPFVSV